MATSLEELFGPDSVIHAYSRAQAIADGALIDVTTTARQLGFPMPVAITRAAWTFAVAWTDEDTDRTGAYQDQEGRLWDVLWMSRPAAARQTDASRRDYKMHLVSVDKPIDPDDEGLPPLVTLTLAHGAGDAGEPVVTIMLPHED